MVTNVGYSQLIESPQPPLNSLAFDFPKKPRWVSARIAAATAFGSVTENIGVTSGDAEAATRCSVVPGVLFSYGWEPRPSLPQQLLALTHWNSPAKIVDV